MQPPGPGRTFFVVVVVFVIVVGDLAATSFRALPTDRRCSALPHTTVNGRATFQPHHPASFATITRAVRRFARHHLAPPSLVVTPRNRRHPSSWNGVSIFLVSRPPSPLLFPFSSPLSSLCLSLSLYLSLSLSSRFFSSRYQPFAREQAAIKLSSAPHRAYQRPSAPRSPG